MPQLIATKRFRYGTRHLEADDLFEASSRDARVLKAIGKAKDAESQPEVQKAMAEVDLADLRVRYAAIVGKRPFNGWDAETLKAKIAEARKA